MTPEAFLAWEHEQPERHEFVDGDRAMVHLDRRTGAAWTYSMHTTTASLLEISEPALALPLRELYAGIDGLDSSIPAA